MASLLLIMQPAEDEALTPYLRAEGFAIERAMDNHDAVERALTGDFALVILEAPRLEPDGVGGVETLMDCLHWQSARIVSRRNPAPSNRDG